MYYWDTTCGEWHPLQCNCDPVNPSSPSDIQAPGDPYAHSDIAIYNLYRRVRHLVSTCDNYGRVHEQRIVVHACGRSKFETPKGSRIYGHNCERKPTSTCSPLPRIVTEPPLGRVTATCRNPQWAATTRLLAVHCRHGTPTCGEQWAPPSPTPSALLAASGEDLVHRLRPEVDRPWTLSELEGDTG